MGWNFARSGENIVFLAISSSRVAMKYYVKLERIQGTE